MADISAVTIPDGSGTATYNIKDATARTLLGGHSVAVDVPANAHFTDTTPTATDTNNDGHVVLSW